MSLALREVNAVLRQFSIVLRGGKCIIARLTQVMNKALRKQKVQSKVQIAQHLRIMDKFHNMHLFSVSLNQ